MVSDAVAARDVLLQLHLVLFAERGVGVDLLLQHAEAVADHDDLVEEVLDRDLLALERRIVVFISSMPRDNVGPVPPGAAAR